MSKYTEELKKQIVLEHKIKHYGARVLQRKYGIPRIQVFTQPKLPS